MADDLSISVSLRSFAADMDDRDECTREDRDMLRAAADEIERLRAELVSVTNKLIHERDEARRSVCEMSLQLGQVFRRIGRKNVEVTTPEGCAEIMRWDCFKGDTDGTE